MPNAFPASHSSRIWGGIQRRTNFAKLFQPYAKEKILPMQAHVTFKYRPPGPVAGLADQDMPTIYSRKTNPQEEIPEVGDIVGLPTEELNLPTSNTKEQQGESEMRFKVVDREDHGTHNEVAGGEDPTQEITLVVTNFDA